MLCFTAYSAIYIGRKNFSVCMPGMIEDGIIDKLSGGTIGTAFLAVYACGQLVNGIIGDKINPKHMISAGLAGSAVCNLLMGINTCSALFPVIWGCNGFFCSMLWAPVIRCLSEYIDESQRSSDGAKISVSLPVGSIASYLVCALFLQIGTWRSVFIACGVILALTSAVFFFGLSSLKPYISVKEAEKSERGVFTDSSDNNEPKGKKINTVVLLFSCGLSFAIGGILFNGILKDGLDLWIPSYISEFFGVKESLTAVLTAILPIVNLLGVFAAKYINTRFTHNEIGTCAAMFLISAVSFLPLLAITHSAGHSLGLAVIAALLLSVTTSAMLGANTMLLTFIPFHFAALGHSSSVTGFLNACSYAAASLSGVIFGAVSSSYGWYVTVGAFTLTALAGLIICLIGIKPWRNGAEKISLLEIKDEN